MAKRGDLLRIDLLLSRVHLYGYTSVVVKTRSTSHIVDTRVLYQSNNTPWQTVGGGVSQITNTVQADYIRRNWRLMIQRGENATTTMSASRNGFVRGPIKVATKKGETTTIPWIHPGSLEDSYYSVRNYILSAGKETNVSFERLKGQMWGSSLTLQQDSALFNKVDNQALMGINRKILSAQRDIQGLVFAGELGESLRMIRRPADALRKGVHAYYHALRKRMKGKYAHVDPSVAKRIVTDTWLEYSFGWKPLIADTYDGAKALANALYIRPDRKFVSYTATGVTTNPGNQSIGTSGGNLSVTRKKEVRKHHVSIKYYGVVGLNQRPGFSPTRFGVQLEDFVPTIWELLPWSFLVDYFINVGEVLSGFQAQAARPVWLARGTETVTYSYWSDVLFSKPADTDVPVKRRYVEVSKVPGTRCSYANRSLSRATYTGTMLPSFEFTIPGMGSKKWLNIAALIASNRKLSDLASSRS